MRITFNNFDSGYKWRNVILSLKREHKEDQIELEFEDWLYEKYQIKYLMSSQIIGIAGIELPDDMQTFLAIKYNIS